MWEMSVTKKESCLKKKEVLVIDKHLLEVDISIIVHQARRKKLYILIDIIKNSCFLHNNSNNVKPVKFLVFLIRQSCS